VLGDPAEPSLAAQLAGLDDDAASHAADALAEAVIFESGRLAFVHPLVRSSVYSELSTQERAGYHERAARLLTGAGKATERIAVHLLATRPGGDPETVNTVRQAAKGASNRGAPDVAVTYLQRALAEPPSPELEPVLVHELGRAALSAGELGMAIEQLRQATRDLADARLRAEAANALGSALFLAHRPEEAMTDLTAVIDELPESEREQGLRLQATRWAAVRGSVAVWRRLQATRERFVVTSRTPRTIGERLHVAVAAYDAARTGTAQEARELALQAFADGRLLEDPGPESGGFWIVPTVLLLAHADDDGARGQHRGDRVGEAARVAASVLHGGSAARVRLPTSRLAGRSGSGCGERARASWPAGLSPPTAAWRSSTSCSRGASRPKRPKSLRRLRPSPRQRATSATCRRALAYGRPRGTPTKRWKI
jgi:tetratricopeptide (TPR) repeat protein